METNVRVAFFPDTFHEVDGVANTSRQFEAFARKSELPFLTVCGGAENRTLSEGSVTRVECHRGSIGFPLDTKHRFDLAFWRHYRRVEDAVRKFGPTVVHITGPSDVGQLGALVAHRLKVPLAASWHTNLHQYAERRASGLVEFLPRGLRDAARDRVRAGSLRLIMSFYRMAHVLFAPNQELMDLLESGTGKSVRAMRRGVDTTLFSPERRDRNDREFVIGYVGRLTVEKNIRFLAELEAALLKSGLSGFSFSVVGQGAEEAWLKANMRTARFAGVLHGEALARAYANMDAFAFPSRTDTFGNVVLEALACGVPAIVTDSGGPRFIIQPGETGFVAGDLRQFVSHIRSLIENASLLRAMREASRIGAMRASWDKIFEGMYGDYAEALRSSARVQSVEIPSTQRDFVVPRLG